LLKILYEIDDLLTGVEAHLGKSETPSFGNVEERVYFNIKNEIAERPVGKLPERIGFKTIPLHYGGPDGFLVAHRLRETESL
jgi:hypothetical protein